MTERTRAKLTRIIISPEVRPTFRTRKAPDRLPDGMIKVSNLSIHVYTRRGIAAPPLVETLDLPPPGTGKYFNRSYVDHSIFAVSRAAVRSSRTYRLICTWEVRSH
jgi:hypothetical protein